MTDKVPEKMTKNILGLDFEIQFAGKPWEIKDQNKSGITKESISLKAGKSYLKVSALQLKGLWQLQKDPLILEEINRRAEAETKEIRQFLPSSK